MSLNSVNTNTGAMVALEALNTTNTQLAATQKQISTGYRVADATDDGAAYAVAQGVRSNVSILTAANNQLGNSQGLLSVTNTALSSATSQMSTIATDLTNLADSSGGTISSEQYLSKLKTDVGQLISYLNGANYNGQSLIGSLSSTGTIASASTTLAVVTDEKGSQYTLNPFAGTGSGSAQGSLATALQNLLAVGGASDAQNALSTSGTGTISNSFALLQTGLQDMANASGAQTNYVTNQVSYNKSKIDSLNSGLGSLVDADLAAESAQLTSLQIKQQLGEQSLSIANQAPSGLISLFRG